MMTTTPRRRKSEKLTSAELKELKKIVQAKGTFVDACEYLDISRPTLERLMIKGSGHPDTLVKLRVKFATLNE